jgi:uncharacterized membrane protein YfcA
MSHLPLREAGVTHFITLAIAIALLLTAAGLLLGDTTHSFAAKRERSAALKNEAGGPKLTTALGFALGLLVSLTSIGAGAIGMAVLRRLYPVTPTVRLVGSDIAHAVPLTLLAGSGHWLLGDVDWSLLGSLLLGSLPGIVAGCRLAHRLPDGVLRRVLGLLLVGVSAPILLS